MPENANSPQPPKAGQQGSAPASQYAPGHVPMTEEFDRAKWTLPPMVPVVIAAVAVAVILAVVAFINRQQPVMSGAITKIASVDQQGNTMVAVQAKINNVIDKQLWIRNVDLELQTADGKKFTDHAAPSSDAQSYIKAFPPLMEANADPLHEELKIAPKSAYTGVAVFSFPVDQKAFNARKSLTLNIQLYDQPPLVLKNP
ncbi:MAG TPA: hypothetical protein VFY05_07210 [Candidatus Angelobacter sp.]|nr:hypothetical protein [Candidatus Angelobacter sp.]